MSRLRVAIAGSGVVGASVAYHLARRGCDVTVVERATGLGAGSTSKATGGFRAQFATAAEVRLSLLSREKLLRFEAETGVDPGYAPHGYLFLAAGEEELAMMREAQRVQHACGLREARMLTASEARALNPFFDDDAVAGAAFCPTDGFIRPMNILRGYFEAARALGVHFVFGCEWQGWAIDGERVAGARTSHGVVEADVFVNAAGAWAGAPVVPLRRNIAATIATPVLPPSMPMTIWAGDWYHLRVRDGRVLLLWPDTPPVDDALWLETVLRLTHARIPALRDVPVAETWSGFYEMSPDERSLLGRSPRCSNLFLAVGSSGHGVMHAPAMGEVIAEMVVDGRASIDVSELDPARFG